MDLGALRELATGHLRASAARLGLDAERTELAYVLNRGGFVNASFTVSDGTRAYHLKLAQADGERAKLRRWRDVEGLLAERYRAPRMVDWLDLGSWEGPLFERLPGVAQEELPPDRLPGILQVVGALHADRELAELLPVRPLRASFLEYFVQCCTEDLADMPEELPPFVDASTFDWMVKETERLARAVAESAAFDGDATVATHGDLWPGNLLLEPGGGFSIVDWDELGRGDPAIDLVLLLHDRADAGDDVRPWLGPRDTAFEERFAVGLRATLLTGVIDSLADWVEARQAPEHMEVVRREKRELHERSLRRYRAIHGAS